MRRGADLSRRARAWPSGSQSLPTPLQLLQLEFQLLEFLARLAQLAGRSELLVVGQVACRIGNQRVGILGASPARTGRGWCSGPRRARQRRVTLRASRALRSG